MTKESRVYGVDGNFYIHRVFHTQSFVPADEALSQATRFLGMICKDAAAVKARRIFVAFDGWNIFRYKVYDGYKLNRGKDGPNQVYDHLPYLKDFLSSAGIPYRHTAQHEADDWMCSLGSQNHDVVIGCRDKDAYQYVRPGIMLYDSSGGKKNPPRKLRYGDIEAEFGVAPELCLDYQTLIGDKIDEIPQLMSPGPAAAGLKIHGSIKEWARQSKRMLTFCRQHQDELNRNRKLVRLIPDLKIGPIPEVKWSDEKLTKAYHEWRKIATSTTRGLF